MIEMRIVTMMAMVMDGDSGGDDDQLHCSHVEFEDSEEEAGDTVVTGGLQLGQTGDQLVGQKRTKTKTKMPTDGLTSSISRFEFVYDEENMLYLPFPQFLEKN